MITNPGSPFTIFMVSTLTVMTRLSRSRMSSSLGAGERAASYPISQNCGSFDPPIPGQDGSPTADVNEHHRELSGDPLSLHHGRHRSSGTHRPGTVPRGWIKTYGDGAFLSRYSTFRAPHGGVLAGQSGSNKRAPGAPQRETPSLACLQWSVFFGCPVPA
jgi:hypothetical protein